MSGRFARLPGCAKSCHTQETAVPAHLSCGAGGTAGNALAAMLLRPTATAATATAMWPGAAPQVGWAAQRQQKASERKWRPFSGPPCSSVGTAVFTVRAASSGFRCRTHYPALGCQRPPSQDASAHPPRLRSGRPRLTQMQGRSQLPSEWPAQQCRQGAHARATAEFLGPGSMHWQLQLKAQKVDCCTQ